MRNSPVLEVVAAHDGDLEVVVLGLPLQEVDLLQQLLLVELELPHDASSDAFLGLLLKERSASRLYYWILKTFRSSAGS